MAGVVPLWIAVSTPPGMYASTSCPSLPVATKLPLLSKEPARKACMRPSFAPV